MYICKYRFFSYTIVAVACCHFQMDISNPPPTTSFLQITLVYFLLQVIPVMLMGKIVSKKTYQTYEYVTAAMLSGGVALFLFSDHDTNGDTSSNHTSATETTFSGVLLMAGKK